MAKDNFERYTMIDKAKRDELYQTLRTSTDPLEQQVVKYSGYEEVPDTEVLTPTGPRKQYRSTWTVAYPKD